MPPAGHAPRIKWVPPPSSHFVSSSDCKKKKPPVNPTSRSYFFQIRRQKITRGAVSRRVRVFILRIAPQMMMGINPLSHCFPASPKAIRLNRSPFENLARYFHYEFIRSNSNSAWLPPCVPRDSVLETQLAAARLRSACRSWRAFGEAPTGTMSSWSAALRSKCPCNRRR